MSRKLIVGITQGDGNGIGYEVIIKALADERMLEFCTPVIYGSSKIFGFYKTCICPCYAFYNLSGFNIVCDTANRSSSNI